MKSFKKRSRLTHHQMTHTGDRPHVCPESGCGKTYVRAAHLKRHTETSHSTQPPVLTSLSCTRAGCEKIYGSQDSLNKHLKTVHEACECQAVYKCMEPDCGETFRKRFQLRYHIYWHKGVLPFQCDFPDCLMKFGQKSHLERHKKRHDGYQCTELGCAEIFTKFSDLRKHREIHRRQQAHNCSICGKVCSRADILRRHIQSEHKQDGTDDEDVHKCPRSGCERFYVNMRNLNAHIKSYHDGQRFPCDQDSCGKTFATKQKLHEHQRLHDPSIPKKLRKGHSKGGARKQHVVTKLTGVSKSSLTSVALDILDDGGDSDMDTGCRMLRSTNQHTSMDHVTPGDGHVMSGNDHVIPDCHVTPGVDHVTLGDDYVTPRGDHVTTGCDNVTPGGENVKPGGDHLTPGDVPMASEDYQRTLRTLEATTLTADKSSSDSVMSLCVDTKMTDTERCRTDHVDRLDLICDQIHDTNIAPDSPVTILS